MSKPRVASFAITCAIAAALASSCTRTEAVEEIPAGTEVTVVTKDGALVRGRLASVEPETVTLTGERPNVTTEVSRPEIKEVMRSEAGEETTGAGAGAAPAPVRESAAIVRAVRIPDNTAMDVTLASTHASDTSRVEEPVSATVSAPVIVDGITVIPAGATLTGSVTDVKESGKVKGRAELAVRFTRLRTGSSTYDIDTRPLRWVAESTKKDDAVKIGTGAAAGAVIGAITGGGKGAAIGSAIGAGGGTAVVLATEGKEVRLAPGRKLKVSLTNPLTIRTK